MLQCPNSDGETRRVFKYAGFERLMYSMRLGSRLALRKSRTGEQSNPKTKPDSQEERCHQQQQQQKSTSIDMYDIIMYSNDGSMHAQ